MGVSSCHRRRPALARPLSPPSYDALGPSDFTVRADCSPREQRSKVCVVAGGLIGCPRSLTPRHFDCGLVLRTGRRATSSRGRSVPALRLVWLVVVLWLALLPRLGQAQERQRLSLEAGTPVTVYADRLENLEREKLLVAEGNVQ